MILAVQEKRKKRVLLKESVKKVKVEKKGSESIKIGGSETRTKRKNDKVITVENSETESDDESLALGLKKKQKTGSSKDGQIQNSKGKSSVPIVNSPVEAQENPNLDITKPIQTLFPKT
ncbi:hypothetical protein A2U01_0036144 [Trifolium medium]|uniref:Uncharacterized protein n=1 Tax=Trifolium medium TaxID=97028 RepID=A0A392PU26_9FABA|nr:hypothetical protein [Trifolium medium]